MYKPQKFGAKAVGRGSDESLNLEAALALVGIQAQEIERQVAQDGEVLGRVVGASTHLIVAEEDVEAPVATVLDPPALRSVQAIQWVEDLTAPDLNPAVILFNSGLKSEVQHMPGGNVLR